MTSTDEQIATYITAGAAALEFNAPLGDGRAESIVDWLSDRGVEPIVDLGCGAGSLLVRLARRPSRRRAIGVDNDPAAIDRARGIAERDELTDRLTFEVGDAATWTGPVGTAICIGASHAFGGPAPMFERLAVVARGAAVVGDGFWEREPDDWCRETFGEQPNGIGGLTDLAERAGWTVAAADMSTLAEWDDFERGWGNGVRQLASPEAEAFADERAAEYERYRGVLGFGWLRLLR